MRAIEETIQEKKEDIERFLSKENVTLSYLFGSFALGRETKLSDIDIAILFDDKVRKKDYMEKEIEISSFFSRIFKEMKREIDIVNLNLSSITLKYQVIKYGKVIYKASEKIRVKFEVETMNYYLDTKYLRDTNFRELVRRIREGKLGE